MHLDDNQFALVIGATPLVSIDLVIRNDHDQVLLGLRRNRPAQGMWFVPGGRIRKNEGLQSALHRVARSELGVIPQAWTLLGAYDHFYADNALGRDHLGTHYVALGCACTLAPGYAILADDQHAQLRWWPIDELMNSPLVHQNTRHYFEADAPNRL
ncbi:GDP-mannose mannosyl hydrolase [Herbaspirillum sp. YR522]|uniref:GDP-mannose mannosyl hydrolase n=1 Tax=Herbaspirillum sp. YR522 TaxID=1144342 RepID=UPI00026FB32D|nr:GDP-mannose mannosyl hydrolase [Herbaspirillum sp. YR522]EJN08823.1 ADP-ribose pyrophosphatase [Herbaspirillum sp. YR522]